MKKAIATLAKEIPNWMETAVVPGLSLALIDEGEMVWTKAFGLADVETNTPVTTNTVFEAASLTKPFFATAVLQLVEEGTLALDTSLITYLPESEQQAERIFEQTDDPILFDYVVNEPRLQQLTTRHVLNHTSGFQNWTDGGKALEFYFSPGERFSYSGNGFNLLQKVIAQLINQAPESMMQERLLNPLGMEHSGLTAQAVEGLRIPTKYNEAGEPDTPYQWQLMYAAASLQTTAVDYGRFLLSLLNPNESHPVLLQPETIAQMWQPQLQVNWNMPWHEGWPEEKPETVPNVAWGLGWGLQTSNNRTAFWHWGDNGCFKAFTLGFADSGTAIAMFTNSKNGDQLWQPILETAFGGEYPILNWIFDKRG